MVIFLFYCLEILDDMRLPKRTAEDSQNAIFLFYKVALVFGIIIKLLKKITIGREMLMS